jgi:hypothetical protein
MSPFDQSMQWQLLFHSDSNRNIIEAASKHMLTIDASIGEAQATLLAAQTEASCGYIPLS